MDSVVAVIYGLHLTLIASLNALLWILALRGRGDPQLLATALLPVFVFVLGTAIAPISPHAAQFAWCLAFLAPFAGWVAARASAKPSPRSP
jgi:hypothetical protein